MNPDAITAEDLTKVYRSFWRPRRPAVTALDAFTLTIPRGAAYALAGPNGAGKTTFVKILTGAVRPTSGAISIFGHPAGSLAASRLIGYVPESAHTPHHLTPTGFLEFHGALAGLDAPTRRKRIPDLLYLTGLSSKALTPMKGFSKGMLQRAAIAQALIRKPELLILDEPTDGLDPAGRRSILDLLRSLHREGVTLLVNSHILPEVQSLCRFAAILHSGRIIRKVDIQSLRPDGAFLLTLAAVPDSLVAELRGLATALDAEPGTHCFRFQSRQSLDWALQQSRSSGARVEALIPVAPTLEDLYLAATGYQEPRS